MIVDTSAILAILRQETEAASFAQAIESSPVCRISVANLLEAAIIIDSARRPIASRQLDELVESAELAIEPVTALQGQIARLAYRDFGRDSSSPAQLNFGDCFAYALAKVYREPLLFKGNDFAHTDIRSALDTAS